MSDSTLNYTPPRPPRRLEEPGKRLWKSVVSTYLLRPDELLVLENACACADLVVELGRAMKGQPLVVKGSMGQEREHPLLSEQRQQRALLNRSLAQLRLPDEGAGTATRSQQARKAATSRWNRGPWAEGSGA